MAVKNGLSGESESKQAEEKLLSSLSFTQAAADVAQIKGGFSQLKKSRLIVGLPTSNDSV